MSNYIQIEIGGKQRGFKFNQMADTEYRVKVGDQTNPIAHTYSMVWAGLISNCFTKGVEVDFTFEDVCDWCESVNDTDFLNILTCYKSTKDFLKDVPQDVKKKTSEKSAQRNTKRNALK